MVLLQTNGAYVFAQTKTKVSLEQADARVIIGTS